MPLPSPPYANPITLEINGVTTTVGPTTWPGHSPEDVQRRHDALVDANIAELSRPAE